ncbi:MAG: P-loop NTPase [Desulfobaccales bacterium]
MNAKSRLKLWSVGGGKGGVGKSIVTLGLGVCLAELGKKIILIDGDLGGANLHTLLGVRFPEVTLEDFLLRRVSRLEDTVIPTQIDNISFISGADDILGAANPTYSQKLRLVQQIQELSADFILLDLGAGTSFNTLDLFNHSPGKIAVLTGMVTSLQNVYGFIKSALFWKLSREFAGDQETAAIIYQMGGKEGGGNLQYIKDLAEHLEVTSQERFARFSRVLTEFQLYLVVNMVRTDQDLKAVQIIKSVCADFLSLQPQMLGHLPFDPGVEIAINQMSPQALFHKKSKAGAALKQMARAFLFSSRLARAIEPQSEPVPVPAY